MSWGLSVRGILGDGWDRSRIFGRLCGSLMMLEDVVVREGVDDVGVERLESVSGHCRGLERGMWFVCVWGREDAFEPSNQPLFIGGTRSRPKKMPGE